MNEDLRFQVVLGDGLGKDSLELTFTYRLLGREEYRAILDEANEEAEIDELVCMLCVEEDYDWRNGLAGAATTMSDFILKSSGLDQGQAEFLLEMYRNELFSNPDFQRDCVIVEAFPHLDIEEVQNWPVVKQLYYYSRAEFIIHSIRGQEIRFITPEQIEAANRMQNVESPKMRAQREPDPDWMSQPSEPQSKTPPTPNGGGGVMSEEELLRLLGATEVSKDIDKESINYYKHKDELLGDYD